MTADRKPQGNTDDDNEALNIAAQITGDEKLQDLEHIIKAINNLDAAEDPTSAREVRKSRIALRQAKRVENKGNN